MTIVILLVVMIALDIVDGSLKSCELLKVLLNQVKVVRSLGKIVHWTSQLLYGVDVLFNFICKKGVLHFSFVGQLQPLCLTEVMSIVRNVVQRSSKLLGTGNSVGILFKSMLSVDLVHRTLNKKSEST